MVSLTISRFSSRLILSISVTCSSHALPNITTTGVLAERSDFMFASSQAATLCLRVLPKAQSLACASFSSAAFPKNSRSFGFEPGFPASIKSTPNWSSASTIFSLSFTEKEIPSPCAPSRRVESSISILRLFNLHSPYRQNSRSLLMPFIYASMLDSIISVDTPRPVTTRSPTLSFTVTSPKASLPPVTE